MRLYNIMLIPVRCFACGTSAANKYLREGGKRARDERSDRAYFATNTASKAAEGRGFWGDLFAIPYSVAPWGWPPVQHPLDIAPWGWPLDEHPYSAGVRLVTSTPHNTVKIEHKEQCDYIT